MAAVQEKAMCVRWFFETKSVIKTQRRYRTQYGKDPPSDNAIRRWLKQFQETGSELNTAWTSYVPRKARMLKLFSILQY
jgi:predicted patatin/cPLA2 family phospholipase